MNWLEDAPDPVMPSFTFETGVTVKFPVLMGIDKAALDNGEMTQVVGSRELSWNTVLLELTRDIVLLTTAATASVLNELIRGESYKDAGSETGCGGMDDEDGRQSTASLLTPAILCLF